MFPKYLHLLAIIPLCACNQPRPAPAPAPEPRKTLEKNPRQPVTVKDSEIKPAKCSPPESLPARALSVPGGTLHEPHTDALMNVESVAFSPDGRRMASGHIKKILLWRLDGGLPERSLQLPEGAGLDGLAFSPDGKHLAASTWRGYNILIYDASTGALARTLWRDSHPISEIAWSPDGLAIASGDSEGVVKIWDVAKGKARETFRVYKRCIASLSWSPDSKRVAALDVDYNAAIWTRASKKRALLRDVYAVVLTSGGVATTSAKGLTLNSKVKIPLADPRGMVADRAGQRLAVAGRSDVTIISAADGKVIETIRDKGDGMKELAFLPGRRLAFRRGPSWPAEIWSLDTGKIQRRIHLYRPPVNEIALDHREPGRFAFAEEQGRVFLSSSRGISSRCRIKHPRRVAFSAAKDQFLVLTESVLYRCDLRTGKSEQVNIEPLFRARTVAESPDGKWFAFGLRSGFDHHHSEAKERVLIVDAQTGKQKAARESRIRGIETVAWSPDSKYVLHASAYSAVVGILSRPEWEQRHRYRLHDTGVVAAFWRDSTTVLSVSTEGELKIWEAQTGKVLQRGELPGCPRAVAFSREAGLLAYALADGAVGVRGVGKQIDTATFPALDGPIAALSFSRQGKHLLAAGSRLRLHRLSDGASMTIHWYVVGGKHQFLARQGQKLDGSSKLLQLLGAGASVRKPGLLRAFLSR